MNIIETICELIGGLYLEYVYPLFVSIRIFIWIFAITILAYALFFIMAIIVHFILKAIKVALLFLYTVLILWIGSLFQRITKSERIQKMNYSAGDVFNKPVTMITNYHNKTKIIIWEKLLPKSWKITIIFSVLISIFLIAISVLNFTEYKHWTDAVEDQFRKIEILFFNINL